MIRAVLEANASMRCMPCVAANPADPLDAEFIDAVLIDAVLIDAALIDASSSTPR